MILRKPYAFLAKHFKLIHLIMTILVGYLIYRTNAIFSFFNDYLSVTQNVIGQDLTSSLFDVWMFIVPFLCIIASIIIISLMFTKKKPITFYIVNIIVCVAAVVLFVYANDTVTTMELRQVDIRVIRAVRDIVMAIFIAEWIEVILLAVRATGFDIKKFNFNKDLEAIEVEESDREEFEVNLEIDTDKTKRDFRRTLRYAKYIYVENKYLINLIAVIAFVTIGFLVFMNQTVYNKSYGASSYFATTRFTMRIDNTYITAKDYKGATIAPEGMSLVIVNLNMKRKTVKDYKLDLATVALEVGGHKFYHNNAYRDRLIDLGNSYDNQSISREEDVNYLLVYEVPNHLLNSKMSFRVEDSSNLTSSLEPRTIHVAINAYNLDKNEQSYEIKANETINLKDSIWKDSQITITGYEIASSFAHTYNFCVRTNECYSSIEYLRPSINNTYDKTLLKISANMELDPDVQISGVYDFYDLMNLVGTVEYELNGEVKTQTIRLKEVVPNRQPQTNVYYIELLKEVEQADKITLILKVRNKTYRYSLK